MNRDNKFESLLFEMSSEVFEDKFSGVGMYYMFEHLLFEMPLGKHQSTKFCAYNW